jgi:hypothetical protein
MSGRIGQDVAWVIIPCLQMRPSLAFIARRGFQPTKIEHREHDHTEGLFEAGTGRQNSGCPFLCRRGIGKKAGKVLLVWACQRLRLLVNWPPVRLSSSPG